jgi:hypothetical protein
MHWLVSCENDCARWTHKDWIGSVTVLFQDTTSAPKVTTKLKQDCRLLIVILTRSAVLATLLIPELVCRHCHATYSNSGRRETFRQVCRHAYRRVPAEKTHKCLVNIEILDKVVTTYNCLISLVHVSLQVVIVTMGRCHVRTQSANPVVLCRVLEDFYT